MEELNFSEGIHTNTKPRNTPPGYYKDAMNMRISGQAKRSEEGTLHMANVPTNVVQWGNCAIGDKTIILGTIASKSIIGCLDKDDQWTMLVPARAGVDILGIVGPTQCEGKKNWAGEEVIYFSTPSGARRINLTQSLPTDDTEFDKVTSLFLEYDLPRVSYVSESSSGQLLSGVYQLSARLVTDSGASTSFGIASPIISVVADSLLSSRHNVNGDPPQTQTTKAITVSISNIDTAFKYIELSVLTYVGLANTPSVMVTNRITINNQSTLEYTYTGAPDNADTLENAELITSGVAYSTGEFFAQKDDSLIIGAPTEAAQPDIDWFRVAQNITAKYVIKRIPFTESLNFDGETATNNDHQAICIETSAPAMDEGYKNPITAALYKGYRRNEVYAFTLTAVYVNGVYGPTVHIPADHATNFNATVDGGGANLGGSCGTFISGEVYPDDRYTGLLGTGLRFHKMPTAKQQPLIEGNVETNNCFIRVLGMKFENIALDPSEIQYADQIAGFIIGRVDRRGQETQLAQGIVRPNVDIQYNNDPAYTRGICLGDGYGSFYWDPREGGSGDRMTPGSAPLLNDFTFLAPDIIHNTYTAAQATHINQHSVYISDPYAAALLRFNTNSFPGRSDFAKSRCFFKNITGANDAWQFLMSENKTELGGTKVVIPPVGVPLAPESKGGKQRFSFLMGAKKLELASTMGCVWMETFDGSNIEFDREHDYLYEAYQTTKSGDDDDDMEYLYRNTPDFRCRFILHTLSRENLKQYGSLDQLVGMFVEYQSWAGFSGDVECYNGDTFICKYGLQVGDENIYPHPNTSDGADSPDKVGFLKPPHMAGIVYMWVESDNNYDYRHYIEPTSYAETNVEGSSGSMPFYPAYKQLSNREVPFGLLSMHAENWEWPGHAKEYNKQYSTQPTNKPYAITPPEDIERRSALQNRVIYSAQAVQGEKADAYQLFLPNNYYDIPQQFGELTDVYLNGELYASTPQVQWKLFFNTLATQATTAGEVVLGTGGAFNRPAIPMTTVDGGYGGNTHWLHAINTVAGRIIVDKWQGKVFMLTDKLLEVSGDLDDTYRNTIQLIDDTNILVGSEPLRERAFIKLDDQMWTFNILKKQWISRHDYKPRWFFSHGPHMYTNQIDPLVGQTGIFKHSLGPSGEYYGNVHESFITLIANMANTTSKLFRNLEVGTRRTTEAGLNIPFETFNKLEVWNDERYSGINTITPDQSVFQLPGVLEVLTRRVKDSFRMVVPRDIVIDPTNDIFNITNHVEKLGDPAPAEWVSKMRGMHVEIKLTANNNNGPIFLFDTKVGLAENIR